MSIVDLFSNEINECIEDMEWIDRVDLYEKKGCNPNIKKILEQNKNSKKFGVFMENITKKIFKFGHSINTEHDFIYTGG